MRLWRSPAPILSPSAVEKDPVLEACAVLVVARCVLCEGCACVLDAGAVRLLLLRCVSCGARPRLRRACRAARARGCGACRAARPRLRCVMCGAPTAVLPCGARPAATAHAVPLALVLASPPGRGKVSGTVSRLWVRNGVSPGTRRAGCPVGGRSSPSGIGGGGRDPVTRHGVDPAPPLGGGEDRVGL